MSADETFFDTNVLLYLLSKDIKKADRAESLVAQGGQISVQVLNEFAAVGIRKLGMTVAEVRETLDVFRAVFAVHPTTVETHGRALALAERYGFNFYDALIVAAALLVGCSKLYSEDMQAGQKIDGVLRTINPFSAEFGEF